MERRTDNIGYAYLKGGDALAEVQRVEALDGKAITCGPDVYMYDFLRIAGTTNVLVLSRYRRNATYRSGHVQAREYRSGSGLIAKVGFRAVATTRAFIALLRFRPNRILCGCMGSLLWASFVVSRIYAVPFVHSQHTRVEAGSVSGYRKLRAIVNGWCIRRATAVLCNGPYLRDQVRSIGVDPERILEFQHSLEHFVGLSEKARNLPTPERLKGGVLLLYVGRLEEDKGVFDLLDACEETLLKDSDIQLVYVGEGAAEQRLRQDVSARGLDGRVVFLGKLPHGQVVKVLICCKVLITPSRSTFPEGRCMATVEGLALGVPVIAPDYGPFPYFVRDGVNGLLFRADSVGALRASILKVLDDQVLYQKLRAGARETGKELTRSRLTFAEAVAQAFPEDDCLVAHER